MIVGISTTTVSIRGVRTLVPPPAPIELILLNGLTVEVFLTFSIADLMISIANNVGTTTYQLSVDGGLTWIASNENPADAIYAASCDQLGNLQIDIRVTDSNSTQASGTTFVFIQDNLGVCDLG